MVNLFADDYTAVLLAAGSPARNVFLESGELSPLHLPLRAISAKAATGHRTPS